MLAPLAALILMIPAIALAADDAPPPSGRITVVQQPAKPAESPAPTPAPTPTPTALASSAPADPAECRIGCAQTNYFCRAGDHPDDCAGAWSQCVATCEQPNLDPGVSTAP
jgi:hypothetical protein